MAHTHRIARCRAKRDGWGICGRVPGAGGSFGVAGRDRDRGHPYSGSHLASPARDSGM
jgi:hypothetical protein